MKSIIFLLSILLGLKAFGITTKKCPSELKLELKNFIQSGAISPSRDNPGLPFAYIALGESKLSFDETLKLVSTSNSKCSYRGKENFSASIEGSLRKGAKKPAVLKAYFNTKYGELSLGYVSYSPIKSISADKTVVLADSRSEVYYRGEDCSFGDCIPNYFKVGNVLTQVKYDPSLSCFGVEKAQEILADYLKDWRGSEIVFEDNEEVGGFTYDFRSSDGVTKYIKTLRGYNRGIRGSGEFVYRGDFFYSYECAASVECWGGFDVSCDGEVTEWQEGED